MSLILHLETIATCNARCLFCPYPGEKNKYRPKGWMSSKLYEKIIDEAATIPEIIWINYGGLGEPCLDTALPERMAYAKEARPDWLLKMYTNGVYLTPEKFDALRDAGLGTLDISLNAVSPEQHERVMGLKDKFYTVCEHINYAITNARGVDIQVKAVVNGDNFTAEDQLKFADRWGIKPLGGYGMTVIEANWGGENRTVRPLNGTKCCQLALFQIVVQWNGLVNLCCVDALGQYTFGDLSKQTIREVYNSPEYVSFREMHYENRVDHPMCLNCTQG